MKQVLFIIFLRKFHNIINNDVYYGEMFAINDDVPNIIKYIPTICLLFLYNYTP